jgi:hypothetical protein
MGHKGMFGVLSFGSCAKWVSAALLTRSNLFRKIVQQSAFRFRVTHKCMSSAEGCCQNRIERICRPFRS